jgi:hypothetical protein
MNKFLCCIALGSVVVLAKTAVADDSAVAVFTEQYVQAMNGLNRELSNQEREFFFSDSKDGIYKENQQVDQLIQDMDVDRQALSPAYLSTLKTSASATTYDKHVATKKNSLVKKSDKSQKLLSDMLAKYQKFCMDNHRNIKLKDDFFIGYLNAKKNEISNIDDVSH